MNLINRDTFFRRVALRECVISGRKLQGTEFLVSAAELSAVYRSAAWNPGTLDTLRQIVEVLVSSKQRIFAGPFEGVPVDQQIRRFLECLLVQREVVPEYCVHAFVFLFWQSVDYKSAIIKPAGEVFFTSASLANSVEPTDRYYKLLQRLKLVTNVDLIAISEEQQHIFLIEIKRGALDDRAVGQILRYFNEASKLLTDRVVRDFNLSYIRPVLVLGEANRQYMEAFPSHFREVLDIFEYTTTSTDEGRTNVVLSHLRRRFLSGYMT